MAELRGSYLIIGDVQENLVTAPVFTLNLDIEGGGDTSGVQ